MGKFQNKVVIVTGASSGIGESTAIAFAKEGAKLFVTGRDKERLNAATNKCKDIGAEVHQFIGDLADFRTLSLIIDEAVKYFGGIDILVNNAAFGTMISIQKLEVELHDQMFATNVRAPVFLSKYAFSHLKKSKGCIVNVSSIVSMAATPLAITYSMTKAALDHFTRGFAAECAPFGVRVNSINPGVVVTRFAENLGIDPEHIEETMKRLEACQPLGLIQPCQVAEGILFLCANQMITGVTFPIDGGRLNRV